MNMNSAKKYLSEEEIDQIVIEQADDDEAWDAATSVHPIKPIEEPDSAGFASYYCCASRVGLPTHPPHASLKRITPPRAVP